MVDTISIPYRREIDHPIPQAYEWLTDYRDDDPERAGAMIVERRPVEEDEDRVVLEGALEILGRRRPGRAVVDLDPPDHWQAKLFDAEDRPTGVYDYRLEPRDDGCELVVDYRVAAPKLKHKLLLTLGRPWIRREIDEMWDGFVEAMDRELAGDGEDDRP